MKADLTRSTFRADQHFRAVRMQQGRVQLDADWNEQQDILNHRVETETVDTLGSAAGPLAAPGFELVGNGTDVEIGAGRYYVAGLLCENEQKVTLQTQPHALPSSGTPSDGIYIGYLEVWLRHLTALEDPLLREVALGGPDTCTRDQLIWQVKLVRAGDLTASLTCASDVTAYDDLIAPPTGTLAARSLPTIPPKDPCLLSPEAGFRRLENLLYRVEVHDATSAAGGPTYKWSRDNGSIESQVVRWFGNPAANEIELVSLGRDVRLSISAGCWIELVDDVHELSGAPGALVQVLKTEGNVVTVNLASKTGPLDATLYPKNPRVRRWDGWDKLAPQAVASNAGWVELEDGVEVKFAPGSYRSGDFWWVPARTATADVEWPKQGNAPAFVPPPGIVRAFAKLGLLKCEAGVFKAISDCRQLFPALSQLVNLFYVGGDGQEALPNPLNPLPIALPGPLSVAVFNGEFPVHDADVQFTAASGVLPNGTKSQIVKTGADGVASITWSVAPDTLSQSCTATLLESSAPAVGKYAHIQFSAQLSRADQVAYDPTNCPDLKAQGVNTVQLAIDALCKQAHGGGCCTTIGDGGDFPDLSSALAAQVEQKETAICLCLLPGLHKVGGGLAPEFAEGTKLSLHGAGSASQLTLGGRFELSKLDALLLRDFDVEVREVNGGFLLSDDVDVLIEHVNVRSVVQSQLTSLVRVSGAERVQVSHCVVKALPAAVRERFEQLTERAPLLKLLEPAFSDDTLGRPIPSEVTNSLVRLTPNDASKFTENVKALRDSNLVDGAELLALDQLDATLAQGRDKRALAQAIDKVKRGLEAKTAGLAFALLDGQADVTLENNDIQGRLSIYGESPTAEPDLDALGTAGKTAKFVRNTTSLTLRGNALQQIRLGAPMLAQLKKAAELPIQDVYGSIIVDGNTLLLGHHELFAYDIALSSNVTRVAREDLAVSIAKQGKYIGNFVHGAARLLVAGHEPEAFGNGSLLIVPA